MEIRMAGKQLSVQPTVDPTASVRDSKLGAYTEVGARTILLEVTMDDYSYVVNDAQITYTTIVGGNPARPIKRRFPENIAGRLAELAWWDWDHETLRRALPDFRKLPVEEFLDKYEAASSGLVHSKRRSATS
jgi:hypothetical protein